ncbi:hypothetical protein NDU88_005450 [Pleurodeles waltl]|uniref:Uncharacterized protein n=1 Tax=Pleurodeles waltl TaxID=8319 RepID=A0AAV7PIK4_PLEWA|nr:hypothetical protein NDU88_005450 [Pleurodeles waltl]
MFEFPRRTPKRITSGPIEDRAYVSGRENPTEQEGHDGRSMGDEEEDRTNEEKASQRENKDLVGKETRRTTHGGEDKLRGAAERWRSPDLPTYEAWVQSLTVRQRREQLFVMKTP